MTSHSIYIPYEVLFTIVELQDSKETLATLRLVNKAISKVATKLLFHTVTTWLVDCQAQRLENIAKHNELRTYVKEIVVMSWEILQEPTLDTDTYLHEVWSGDFRINEDAMPPDVTIENFDDHVQTIVQRQRAEIKNYGSVFPRTDYAVPTYSPSFLKQGQIRHREAYQDYTNRIHSGSKSLDFTSALMRFSNLSIATVTNGVGIHSENCQLFRDTGIAPTCFLRSYGRCIFNVVMESLAEANTDLKQLMFCQGDFDKILDERILCRYFPSDEDPIFLGVLHNLLSLIIRGIQVDYPPSGQQSWTLQKTRAIVRIVEACPELKVLNIGLSIESRYSPPLRCLLPHWAMKQLKSLNLEYLVVSEDELVGMIDTQKDTLTTLDLRFLCLRDGSWLSFVDKMHNRLSLCHATMRHLFEDPNRHPDVQWGAFKPVRACFDDDSGKESLGCGQDYITHRIDFNPLRRASESGSRIQEMLPHRCGSANYKIEGYCCDCPR